MKRHVRPEQQPRYAYDVEFAPQLGSYVVAGSSGDRGFVSLVSLTGEIVKTRQGLPSMAAETRLGWVKFNRRLSGQAARDSRRAPVC